MTYLEEQIIRLQVEIERLEKMPCSMRRTIHNRKMRLEKLIKDKEKQTKDLCK